MTHPHTHDPDSEKPDPSQPFTESGSRPTPSLRAARGRLPNGDAAELEISALHRASIAHALLTASAFPAQSAAYRDCLCSYPLRPEALRTWSRRTARMLELIALDTQFSSARVPGSLVTGLKLLRSLLRRSPSAWPSAARLARCSSAVLDSETARTAEGFASLISGSAPDALQLFSRLLQRRENPEDQALLEEGTAYSYILLKDVASAQQWMERAAERPGGRVSALAWSLNLALRTGHLPSIERAAARLDLLVDATSTEFAACLARMRAGGHLFRVSPEMSLDPVATGSIRVTEWARECRSSSGRVARTMG